MATGAGRLLLSSRPRAVAAIRSLRQAARTAWLIAGRAAGMITGLLAVPAGRKDRAGAGRKERPAVERAAGIAVAEAVRAAWLGGGAGAELLVAGALDALTARLVAAAGLIAAGLRAPELVAPGLVAALPARPLPLQPAGGGQSCIPGGKRVGPNKRL